MNSPFATMKAIFRLLLSGVVLLTSWQAIEQAQALVPNIDSLQQVLTQETNPVKRLSLKRQIADLSMKTAKLEDRCRVFEDLTALVEEDVYMLNLSEKDYLQHYYEYRLDEEGNRIEPHDSIKQKELYYAQEGLQIVELGEGVVELALSPAFFAKYLSQLPAHYQEYWQLSKDSENIAPDAGLVLTWREMGDLIARYEAYAKAYPDQKGLLGRLGDDYQSFQMFYMTGTDNTCIADRSGSLLPELRKEWQRFMKAYPNSLTTVLIKDFLKRKDYRNLNALRDRVERVQKSSNHPLLLDSSSL